MHIRVRKYVCERQFNHHLLSGLLYLETVLVSAGCKERLSSLQALEPSLGVGEKYCVL